MSSFINTKTMQFPLHEEDLYLDFGIDRPDYIKPLIYAAQEGAENGQTYEKNEPIEIDGQWIVNWTIRDKTLEELKAEKEFEDWLNHK